MEIIMEQFSTKDIYLASFLLASGYKRYSLRREGRIAWFDFEDDDNKLKLDVDEYWSSNCLVDPKELFNSFKELKNRIYENVNGDKYGQSRMD